MIIKEYEELVFKGDSFYLLKLKVLQNFDISFLSTFLISDFEYIRQNLEQQIQYHFIDKPGIGFEMIEINVDHENNLIYIGSMPDPCDYEDEDYPFISGKTPLEHFQEGLLESVHLTKDNFFNILRTWNKYLEEKPPFLLLYQDENNWFDILPFQSKEEMDQFVENHTPIIN